VATLAATLEAGYVFTGWTIDGVFRGWANPLTLTMNGAHAAVVTFAAPPALPDVPAVSGTRRVPLRGFTDGAADENP